MEFCEFIAEEQLIKIIPHFKYEKQLNLISGDFGPFIPSIPIDVPIWLAVHLSRQHKCTIVLPEWITELERAQENQDNIDTLIRLPSEYWLETLHILRQQVPSMPNFTNLIEKRDSILRNSIHALFKYGYQSKSFVIKDVTLNNVSRGELQGIKPMVQSCFAQLQELRQSYFECSTKQ